MAIQPTDPAVRGKAVGIDLGTTNSLVAYVEGRGAQVACLTVDEGSRLLPSAVAYLGNDVVVGGEAKRLSEKNPREVILSAKRFVGKSANDPEVRQLSPYDFDPESQRVIRFVLGERKVTPVEVSAEILRRLKAEAERTLGKVTQAVVTVPAYFDDAQRQATKDAGKLAGLEVLRLLNEPTAAALAYGLDTQQNGTFAVYDLGGGTFDISILELDDGVFQVKSTAGDSALGGDDFDRALAEQFLTRLGKEAHTNPHLVRHAIDAAKSAKEALTDAERTTVELTNGTTTRFELTRQELEAAMRPILERSRKPCERALADADVDGPLDGVVLVGGSTRSPLVRQFVEELFGLKPLFEHDPDEVVALGAAVQANQLAGDVKAHDDILLLDVNPLSLGVETMGGLVEKIIPRNSNIPVAAQQTFTTFVDGQTALDIHVLQGEREFVQDCRSLARFTLRGIPPMAAGMGRVQITFQVDADGLLTVLAKEEVTGVEQSVIVRPSHGLTDAEVERMLRESFEHGEEDVAARLLVEARVDAKRILDAAQKQFDHYPDLVSDEERANIEAAMQALVEAAQGDEHGPINDLILALDQASAEFATRIVNRGMQKSLGGRSIAEYDGDETSQEPKMTKVTYRFEGKEIVTHVKQGTNLLDAGLDAGARMGHACGGVCACSTCHVYVPKGFNSLVEADDDEQDILDKAFDVKWNSRLGCQAEVGAEDVEVDISEESLQAWYDENPVERKERDERLKAQGKAIPGPARDLRNR